MPFRRLFGRISRHSFEIFAGVNIQENAGVLRLDQLECLSDPSSIIILTLCALVKNRKHVVFSERGTKDVTIKIVG